MYCFIVLILFPDIATHSTPVPIKLRENHRQVKGFEASGVALAIVLALILGFLGFFVIIQAMLCKHFLHTSRSFAFDFLADRKAEESLRGKAYPTCAGNLVSNHTATIYYWEPRLNSKNPTRSLTRTRVQLEHSLLPETTCLQSGTPLQARAAIGQFAEFHPGGARKAVCFMML